MPHIRVLLSVLLLSTGVGGLTVAIIFRKRVSSRILSIVTVQTALFALGLLVSIAVFYIQEIAAIQVDISRIAGYFNGGLVLVLYAGLALVAFEAGSASRLVLALLGAAVVIVYLLFAFVGPNVDGIYTWMRNNRSAVTLVSVTAPSAYLLYGGLSLWSGGRSLPEAVSPLVRWIGGMLIAFAVGAVGLTIVAVAADWAIDPTELLNFALFVGWNLAIVMGFVRYLNQPRDVFEEGGIPDEVAERYGISPREREVVLLLSRGLSNKEIAEKMNVAFTTARTHIYNVYKKTGAASRVELLRILSQR